MIHMIAQSSKSSIQKSHTHDFYGHQYCIPGNISHEFSNRNGRSVGQTFILKMGF